MSSTGPLDSLIVDEKEAIDTDLLASTIRGVIKFTKDGEIIFEKKFYELKGYKKILIYLLGRKVIIIKKLKESFSEEVTPKDIADILGIPPKSITKYASIELKGIIKSEKGKYKVPNYNLHKCSEVLK